MKTNILLLIIISFIGNIYADEDYIQIAKKAPSDWQMPEHSYFLLSDLDNFILSLQEKYPEIVRVYKIGESNQKRNMYALKISDNVGRDEPNTKEPELLFTTGTHPREQPPVHYMVQLLKLLTENYYSDSKIKKLVDSREIWFVLMTNPDSKHADFPNANPSRWNRRGLRKTREFVDMNRSWPLGWGIKRSKKSSTYPGHEPLATVESKNIEKFISSRNFVTWMEIHSNMQKMFPSNYMSPTDYGPMKRLYDGYIARQKTPFTQPFRAMVSKRPPKRTGLFGSAQPWGYLARGIYSVVLETHREVNRRGRKINGHFYHSVAGMRKAFEENGKDSMLFWIEETGNIPILRKPNKRVDPSLKIKSVTIHDGDGKGGRGNGNGIIQKGETITLEVNLENTGASVAKGVWGVLYSKTKHIRTTNYVHALKSPINANSTGKAIFKFRVSSLPSSGGIPVQMSFYDDKRNHWFIEYTLPRPSR